MIEYKTFYSTHKTTDKEVLKQAYKTWKVGAINISSNEKANYYYNHFVVAGISFEDFIKLVDETEGKQ